VDGDRTQVPLVDLGGVLFSFDHDHRLDVLGECLGLPSGRVDELLWQSGVSAGCDARRYRDAAATRAQIRRVTGCADCDEHLDAAWCNAFCQDWAGILQFRYRTRRSARAAAAGPGG
jgi:hypothetical protein